MTTDNPDLTTITIDDLYDVAVLAHGFLEHNRDYYFHIEALWKDNYAGQYLLTFTHCCQLTYKTNLSPVILKDSWDDCFLDLDNWTKNGEPAGWFWWSNFANAYPGFSLVDNSELAEKYSSDLGEKMNELKVITDVYQINLLFHKWTIKKLNSDTGLVSQYIIPFKKW